MVSTAIQAKRIPDAPNKAPQDRWPTNEGEVSITLEQLRLALATWEVEARIGNCMLPRDAAKLSIDEHSSGAAAYLFGLLRASADCGRAA